MKKTKIAFITTAIVLLIGGLVGLIAYFNSPLKIINSYPGELPHNMTIKYHIDTVSKGFSKEGSRYTIFKLKSAPDSKFIASFSNEKMRNDNIEEYQRLKKEFEEELIVSLNQFVPSKDYFPNFTENYFWSGNAFSTYALMYFPDSLHIYAYQWIS